VYGQSARRAVSITSAKISASAQELYHPCGLGLRQTLYTFRMVIASNQFEWKIVSIVGIQQEFRCLFDNGRDQVHVGTNSHAGIVQWRTSVTVTDVERNSVQILHEEGQHVQIAPTTQQVCQCFSKLIAWFVACVLCFLLEQQFSQTILVLFAHRRENLQIHAVLFRVWQKVGGCHDGVGIQLGWNIERFQGGCNIFTGRNG